MHLLYLMLTSLPACAQEPAFHAVVVPITPENREAVLGTTWREGCPVPPEDLVLLEFNHWGYDGAVRQGQLVAARRVAPDLIKVFGRLFEVHFPLQEVAPAASRGGDDAKLMAENVTSGFNCRPVTGGGGWSAHATGEAIDVNPLHNPYVRGDRVLPEQGRPWVDRQPAPGVILADGPVVAAFREAGWHWGGAWSSLKDYQHFSTSGR